MIVSVPHTGTRTLARVLGEVGFKHFGQNERDFVDLEDEHFHFPIRDPLDTTVSWRCYNQSRTDMGEFRRWEKAIEFLADRPHTIHRIEDFPVLEGKSFSHWSKDAVKNRDIEALKQLPEVRYLLEWFKQPKIRDFFRKHYPEGFWWESTEQQSN